MILYMHVFSLTELCKLLALQFDYLDIITSGSSSIAHISPVFYFVVFVTFDRYRLIVRVLMSIFILAIWIPKLSDMLSENTSFVAQTYLVMLKKLAHVGKPLLLT